MFEGEAPRPAGVEPRGDLRRLDHEGARSAHRIEQRFGAVIAAFAQEQRRHGLPHRGGVQRLLVAALVQRLAGGIDADGADVVLDPHHHHDLRLGRERRAKGFADRGLDALGGGAAVVDARPGAGGLDAEWRVRAQDAGPGHAPRPVVELREMDHAELVDARQHAPGAPDPEIGAPDLWPATPGHHAARHRARLLEPLAGHLGGQDGLEPRRGGQEDLEIVGLGHRARGAGRAAA